MACDLANVDQTCLAGMGSREMMAFEALKNEKRIVF